MNDRPPLPSETPGDPNDRINRAGQVQLDDLELERPHIVREMVDNIVNGMKTMSPDEARQLDMFVSNAVDQRLPVIRREDPGFGGVADHKTLMKIRERMIDTILEHIKNGPDIQRG